MNTNLNLKPKGTALLTRAMFACNLTIEKQTTSLADLIRYPTELQIPHLFSNTWRFEMSERQMNREISPLREFLGNVTQYVKICCVIKPLQLFVARNSCRQKMAYMRSLPVGTVGHDLANMLDSKGLKLIPGFTKHDLDHVVLGYSMDPEEELCMQAYLIGNGRWQLQCFLFLSSAVLLPGLWGTLWAHYNLGKQSEPLATLALDDCLDQRTEKVRRKYAPSHINLAATVNRPTTRFVG